MATNPVVVPNTITVHLGRPDEAAENVTVTFTDYIKNVASNEIYPTWPDSAIRANILAQISFALNRIYTEYYRSRGYDFDITNNTVIDQAFVKDGEIFDNISKIVDQIFNNYINSANLCIKRTRRFLGDLFKICWHNLSHINALTASRTI